MEVSINSEWMESLQGRPTEVKAEVYEAVITYLVSGTVSDLKPMSAAIFSFIKREIDAKKRTSAQKSKAGKKSAEKRKGVGFCSNSVRTPLEQVSTEKKEEVKEKVAQKELQEIKRAEEKDIDKSISKKKDDRAEFVEGLPGDWQDVVKSWLRYKIDRKENYKSLSSLKIFYKNLQEYSGNNVSVAQKVVEQSIGNNWQGIFPLQNQSSTRNGKVMYVVPEDPKEYFKDGGHIV